MKKLLLATLLLSFSALSACSSTDAAEGSEGGACYPNGTCDTGLVCVSGTCARPTQDAGVDGGGGSGGGGGTGGTAGTGGACSADFGLEPEFFAQCAAEACCPALESCAADETCNACLTLTTVACETDSLFVPLFECLSTECPTSFCGTGVGVFAGIDPIACNKCIDTECCVPVLDCLGGEGEPDFAACTSCIDDPGSVECQSAPEATQIAAADFVTCRDTSCAAACAE